MYTATEACLLYVPGAVCFSNMVREHVFKIIIGPEQYGAWAISRGKISKKKKRFEEID